MPLPDAVVAVLESLCVCFLVHICWMPWSDDFAAPIAISFLCLCLSAGRLGKMIFPEAGLLVRVFSPNSFMRRLYAFQKKPWWDGCARCNWGWFCRISFVSLNVCPPTRLLNLMSPGLAFFLDMCMCFWRLFKRAALCLGGSASSDFVQGFGMIVQGCSGGTLQYGVVPESARWPPTLIWRATNLFTFGVYAAAFC